MGLTLRKDYEPHIYEIITREKEDTIQNNDITLRQVLDAWWNSVRIDNNICYKNAYKEDGEYELGNLTEADLERKVFVDFWDEDSDGYPICYAEFVD